MIAAVVLVVAGGFAVSQVAQRSLRSVIGKSDLDDLLTNRERLNQGLELMIDNPALDWGIHIDILTESRSRMSPSGNDETVDVTAGRGRTGSPREGHLGGR